MAKKIPNANYLAGAAAERTVKRDLEQCGFSCIRAAASHGIYDVIGVRGDSVVFVQVKRGKTKPSPSEYQNLIDMPVPENALKLVVFYPVGSSARVIYRNLPLPEWCGFVRWFDGMPPKQTAMRGMG